jgi:hypothetical protein
MVNTACLTPDGAMLCALCLAGPVCKIHPSLVAPVLSYGCEVWGLYALASIGTQTCAWGAGNALLGESVQKAFLRDSLRVSQSATVVLMMNEVGNRPLAHAWAKQLVRWWDRMVSR